jgi:hypothetical protein
MWNICIELKHKLLKRNVGDVASNVRRGSRNTASSRFPFGEVRGRIVLAEGQMIRKVKGGYKVLSSKGRNLGGPYKTKGEAEKRLRQVEFFKHAKG